MTDQIEIPVPPHLQELVEPTPSGTAKLIAAWDGLTAESQMLMLTAKKSIRDLPISIIGSSKKP